MKCLTASPSCSLLGQSSRALANARRKEIVVLSTLGSAWALKLRPFVIDSLRTPRSARCDRSHPQSGSVPAIIAASIDEKLNVYESSGFSCNAH